MKNIFFALATALLFTACTSCNNNPTTTIDTKPAVVEVSVPVFNADSCYSYVKAQVDFGPRVPNTKAHIACGNYLISFFKKYADTVYVQQTTVTTFDKKSLKIKNIIAVFKPQLGNRLLLCSHWDSRPFADQETDLALMKKPIDAADDGASGVGVLMELAQQLKQNPPTRGVDLICLDAEDWGEPEHSSPLYVKNDLGEDSYCLGTQYWSKNPHVPNYTAANGVVLDMVGARGATFVLEDVSMHYAGDFMQHVWQTAASLGYGNYFINQTTNGITDDHTYINKLAHIPTIDIVYHDLSGSDSWFAPHWHTQKDNMSVIDRNTLKAVGQTLTAVIYKTSI